MRLEALRCSINARFARSSPANEQSFRLQILRSGHRFEVKR